MMGLLHLPWTIWRQTFLELWRLLLITAGVLVTVISFAVSVLLTAQGKLGPFDTIRYMFYAMPPMLQFALPFAAGFAATLSYHRMSQDNELSAAAAGGVSHRALLVPAVVSGVILAGVMSLLLDEVVPRFFREMERIVAQDAARLVEAPIAAGRPLEFGGTMIHADKVRRLSPSQERGVFGALLLTGVFVLDLDENGRPTLEVTASQAVAEFSRGDGKGGDEAPAERTRVALRLKNPMEYSATNGLRAGDATFYYTVPSQFNDNPKFRTTRELLALPGHPDSLRFIDEKRRELAGHIAERRATQVIDRDLRGKGEVRLTDGAGRDLRIRAGGIVWQKDRWELTPIAGKGGPRRVEVDIAAKEGAGVKHLSAASGGMTSSFGDELAERQLSFKLELENYSGRERASDPAGVQPVVVFQHLMPAENPAQSLMGLTSHELLSKEVPKHPGDPFIARPAEELSQVLEKVGREIVSKYHERWASCIAALIMVVAGALTAMRLGTSLPLAVYLWSFFPALLAVITISAGQSTAHKVGLFGLVILWGGVGMLAAYTAGAFAVVRRH